MTTALWDQVKMAFASGQLSRVVELVKSQPDENAADGAHYLKDILGKVDSVRYTDSGVAFQPESREITAPQAHEVLIMPTAVSLCGTDLSLIDKAQHGELPAETQGKVVGHEAAGVIVGVGADVKEWQIGQLVCLDSHYACSRPQHHTFQDCVMSGESCDGIVGGIRGAMATDGHRDQPYDGYWSRVMAVPASALPVELPVAVAEQLAAPSTLESLGNIYMMLGQLKDIGLLAEAQRTVMIVSGLGATGYPMAAIGTHYGFQVVGVNPSAGKREFSQQAGVITQGWADTAEVLPYLQDRLAKGEIDNLAVMVTADHPSAHEAALKLLSDPSLGGLKRKVAVIFGLFSDAKLPMPGLPAEMAGMPQRDFVFSRKHFTSPEGVEVYGVCGRDLRAWETLMQDLQPEQPGQQTMIAQMLNKPMYQVTGSDPLQQLATELNQGSEHLNTMLNGEHKLKVVANFMKAA